MVISNGEERKIPSRPARRSDSVKNTSTSHSHYTNSEFNDNPFSSSATTPNTMRPSLPHYYNGGHYAESPIHIPQTAGENKLVMKSRESNIGSTSDSWPRRKEELAGKDTGPIFENQENEVGVRRPQFLSKTDFPVAGKKIISKVTRSHSLISRPAGIVIHKQPFHPEKEDHSQGTQYAIDRPAASMSLHSKPTHEPNTTSTKAGVVIETMSAPNPFCPNTRGVCCLMLLVNLALILVAIGFIIVLQLPEPILVWNLGVVILVFGFLTFFVALLYCVCICQEASSDPNRVNNHGQMYWTHHWQKNITIPEITNKISAQTWREDYPQHSESDSSSRDYPRLYLESEYATERDGDFETDREQSQKKN